MNKNQFKKLSIELFEDIGIKINSIDEIKSMLLNSKETAIRSSMAYFIAEYKIIELQKDVINILCSPISKNNDSTLIYASYQFECSQYFKVYTGIILERDYHSVLESYKAIRKCRNVPILELEEAKKALETWSFFFSFSAFSANKEIESKIHLIQEILDYLKKRIKREKSKLCK